MKATKKPILTNIPDYQNMPEEVEVWKMGDLAKILDYQNMPEWVQDEIDESMWIAYIILSLISMDSYLIKEASGGLYPCEKEFFEKTYDIIS